MKKRIIALLLSVTILAAMLLCTESAADVKLNFISINDTLPPELINVAVYYNSRVYVPCWLFSNYGLGITYVYFASNSTAYLYSGDKQLFFELVSGKTYDGDDYYYSVSAILQGGTVYLPLGFVCSFFGSPSYATIGENEYGSVMRITTGAQVLSDQEFLRAAKNAMRIYYQNYNKALATPSPSPTATPNGSPSPTPPVTQTPEPPRVTPTAPPREGDTARLALLGLPDEQLLEQLQRLAMGACFFLTEEEIRSEPDMVRQLACEGHPLGIYCPTGDQEEYEEAMALLWEIIRVRTDLAYVPAECPAPQGSAALIADAQLPTEGDPSKTVYELTTWLENGHGEVILALPYGEKYADAVSLVLQYMHNIGFTVLTPRITDVTEN